MLDNPVKVHWIIRPKNFQMLEGKKSNVTFFAETMNTHKWFLLTNLTKHIFN